MIPFSKRGYLFYSRSDQKLIQHESHGSRPTATSIQHLFALPYLATTGQQQAIADTFNITQVSVSRVMERVVSALSKYLIK